MFSDIELENCPELFAFNCKRFEIECHDCKANNSGKYLKYLPINKSIQNHPVNIKHKKKGVASYSRKGRVNEFKIIDSKPYLTKTYASGSIGGDGDAKLHLAHINSVSVEIKTRYTDKGAVGPSKKEIIEGLSQRAQLWIIQHKVYSSCYYYLTFDLFINIQKTIFMSSIKCTTSYTASKYTSFLYEKYGYEHCVRSIVCKGMYNKKISNDRFNMKIILIDNKIGQFVMMTEGVFDEIVSLYNIAINN